MEPASETDGVGIGDMDKGWYIADLVPGLEFADAVFVVGNARFQDQGKGPKLVLTIRDATGERKAKCWHPTEAMRSTLQAPDIAGDGFRRLYRISGKVDDKEAYSGEIILATIDPVLGRPRDLRPYLEPPPANRKEVWDRFAVLLRSVKEPHLYLLLKSVFDEPTRREFIDAVAAQSHHHSHRGGLIEHSVEVAELCQQACGILPGLSRDLLVTGALLHDIGKLEEIQGGLAAGEFTDAGTLHGHTYLGTRRVERTLGQIADFPVALGNALIHMLLSHHGTAAFGAPTSPAFGEAVVLSQCDLISARAFTCRAARRDAAPGQSVLWRSLGDSSRVYVGPLGTRDDEAIGELPNSSWDEDLLTLPEITLPAASKKTGEPPPGIDDFVLSKGLESNIARLPVRGSVAAGDPERSTDDGEEEIVVVTPAGGADFLVRVNGDSMIGAGIFERDLLLVRSQETARHGEIVVAHIPGEGQVVKRFRKESEGSRPELHSENVAYSPLVITEGTRIQGKVVGLHRVFPA